MTDEELRQVIEQTADSGATELDLSANNLTCLPPEIGQLTNLTKLDLRYNHLRGLPSEIGQLTSLTRLNLEGNQLTSLLGEIAQLTNLKQLNLTNLKQLNLTRNQLKDLPPEIFQLTNLTKLQLGGNKLTVLPPEIFQLINLTHFSVTGNKLMVLPPEIFQLINLTELFLSNNQLTSLPPGLGNLTNLTLLDLGANKLKALPSEIAQLKQLTTLYLDSNQLTDLPLEIIHLSNLQWLGLTDNPLSIPLEILANAKKPAAILNYYRQQQSGSKKALNEAKLLLMGLGSVGKTSLVNRLLHDRFDPQENKTEGINIQHWPIQIDNCNIQLNVWDFGGQEIMHATHQFFLTKRSLYLLVLDTRLGEDENRLEYWLKIIESFGDGAPVIVVGNKSDQQALDLDRRGLQLKYPSIQAFVETSCQTGQGIDVLKAAIVEAVSKLKHVKDELPLSWFGIKQQLEEMDRDYLSYQEYMQLCQDRGIKSEQSQQTLVGFLHDLGVVLNFRDDPRLEDTNILNPVWVTNGVYRILNDNVLMSEHKGILRRSMLDRILDSRRYPRSKQLFILDMMRKFELCFDLEPDKTFLIPDLLSKEEPDIGEWEDGLRFQYHYKVLPGSIISRFIVRASEMIENHTVWRSGVVLASEGSRALIKSDRADQKIFICISGSLATRRAMLYHIRRNFDSIHRTISGLEVTEKVPLQERPDIVVDYQYLLDLEEIGEATFVPPGLKRRVSVKALLEGMESEADRVVRQNGQDGMLKPHPPGHSSAETRQSPKTPPLYRLVLPMNAITEQRRWFEQQLAKFKADPVGWAVMRDRTRPNEEQAFLITRRDRTFQQRQAAYLISTTFQDAFKGGYRGRSRSRSEH